MPKVFLTIIVYLFIAGCTSNSLTLSETKSNNPQTGEITFLNHRNEVEQMFARELSNDLPVQTIQSQDNFFLVKVKAVEKPEVVFDKNRQFYSFDCAIGTRQKVSCLIFKEPKDLGSLAKTMIDKMISHNSSIKDWSLKKLSSGVLAEQPYFHVQIIYEVISDKGEIFGELEYFLYNRLDSLIVLFHDEPGYSRTFFDLAKTIVESLKINTGKQFQIPDRHLIYIGQINENHIGFLEQREYGADTLITTTSSFVPVGTGKFEPIDEVIVEKADIAGNVKKMIFITVTNGMVTLDIEMENVENTKYAVKGKIQGKEIACTFETDEPIVSNKKIESLIKEKLLTNLNHTLSSWYYSPDINPLGAINSTIENIDGRIMKQKIGPLVAQLKINSDNAIPERIEIPFGPNKLIYNLVMLDNLK